MAIDAVIMTIRNHESAFRGCESDFEAAPTKRPAMKCLGY
jgi:hypothetical protein